MLARTAGADPDGVDASSIYQPSIPTWPTTCTSTGSPPRPVRFANCGIRLLCRQAPLCLLLRCCHHRQHHMFHRSRRAARAASDACMGRFLQRTAPHRLFCHICLSATPSMVQPPSHVIAREELSAAETQMLTTAERTISIRSSRVPINLLCRRRRPLHLRRLRHPLHHRPCRQLCHPIHQLLLPRQAWRSFLTSSTPASRQVGRLHIRPGVLQ